ncbi:MAG TPA: hypothetical protein VHO06_22460 [Polyangia bacterium]|nr:hypothetical protein [Polyangia bacterium]
MAQVLLGQLVVGVLIYGVASCLQSFGGGSGAAGRRANESRNDYGENSRNDEPGQASRPTVGSGQAADGGPSR